MLKLLPSHALYVGLCIFSLTIAYFLTTPFDELPPQEHAPAPLVSIKNKNQTASSTVLTTGKSFPFVLQTNTTKASIPDLRSILLYYGKLLRPDSREKNPTLYIGIKGEPEPFLLAADKPAFLQFDNDKNQWKFVSTSPLKITFHPKEKSLEVALELTLSNEQIMKDPTHLAQFILTETLPPLTKSATTWLLDDMPVDIHFLDNQKVLWQGQDAFYAALSEDEEKKSSQKVVVQGGLYPYTLWVKEHSSFIYTNGKWEPVCLGPQSIGKTLLYTKSVSEKTITFELWKDNGSFMVPLTLTKKETPSNLKLPSIQLVGARSKDTWIATINGTRVLLRTDDWLLCNDKNIEKIEDIATLEAYICGEKEGTLLAFSGIERQGTEQNLVGIAIDPLKTTSEPFSVSLFHSWKNKGQTATGAASNSKEDKDFSEQDNDELSDTDDEPVHQKNRAEYDFDEGDDEDFSYDDE